MPKFTEPVYIPEPIYRLLPWLYFSAALFLWIIVETGLAKLVAVGLVLFGAIILIQRMGSRNHSRGRNRR